MNFPSEAKPLTVLHIFGRLNRGGAETMVMNLMRATDPNTVKFNFVTHGTLDEHFSEEILLNGGEILQLPSFNILNYFQYRKSVRNILKPLNRNIIIHCHVRSTGKIILKEAKKLGFRTISHSHSVANGIGFKSKIKNHFQSGIEKYADKRLACSTVAGEWLFGNASFDILYNGIAVDRFCFSQENRTLVHTNYDLADKVVIGNVARFVPAKNHIFLIEVFHKLLKINNSFHLLLVGDGTLKSQIQHQIKVLDLVNNVTIIDSNDDVHQLYSAMDVFVLPSLFEGLGMVLVEAQINGLKCVATQSIPKEVDLGMGNIEFVELDQDEWVSSILEQSLNPNTKRNLIETNAVDNYRIENVRDQLVLIYKRLSEGI